MILCIQKLKAAKLAKDFDINIGMVIEEFVMVVIII